MNCHPDCTQCCQLNRCHWCLIRPAEGNIVEERNGYQYSICRNHMRYFQKAGKFENVQNVSPLLSLRGE